MNQTVDRIFRSNDNSKAVPRLYRISCCVQINVTAQTSKNMTQRFVTAPFEESVTIQGTVCLNIKAALKDGDATVDFHPENRNDADTLTMQLGVSKVSGKMDDIEIAVLLCDVCDEEFDSIQTVDPERNVIPDYKDPQTHV